MPNVNVTFDSNNKLQFSVRVTAGWRGRKLVYLSDRLVASSMLPEQL